MKAALHRRVARQPRDAGKRAKSLDRKIERQKNDRLFPARSTAPAAKVAVRRSCHILLSIREIRGRSLRLSPRASRSFDPGLTQRRRDAEAQRSLVVRTRFTNPPPVRFRRPPLFPSLDSVKSSQENKDSRDSVTGRRTTRAEILHEELDIRFSQDQGNDYRREKAQKAQERLFGFLRILSLFAAK